MIKPIKKLTHSKREFAQTMVEFALVFPLILVVTYGIIEFGRMIFIYSAVTNAAREGARYGASVGERNDYHYLDCAGVIAAVQKNAFLISIDPANIVIKYEDIDG